MTAFATALFDGDFRSAIRQHRRGKTALTPQFACELIARLETEKEALHRFTVETEEEFLRLGAALRNILSTAREIQGKCGEIMQLASGRGENSEIRLAFELAHKAESLVRASREQEKSVAEVFGKLQGGLNRISRERNTLIRALQPLEIVSTQIRIQASTFDDDTREQFFGLAHAIRGIVGEIRSALQQPFDELDQTGEAAETLVLKLNELSVRRNRETDSLLRRTRDNLTLLNDLLFRFDALAQSASDSGMKAVRGTGQAIVALQCQDMARQKIQHASAAVDEMIAHLSAGTQTGFHLSEEADCWHFLADASRLQLGQLGVVFDQLDKAAALVVDGLREVEAESASLSGCALRAGASSLDARVIGLAVESLHGVLNAVRSALDGVDDVIHLVTTLQSTYSDCTARILRLVMRLRLVALNAQIFASRARCGAALEVIAGATRSIADESVQHLESVSSRVTDLVELVADLKRRLSDYRDSASRESAAVADAAKRTEDRLLDLEDRLRRALGDVNLLQDRLSEDVSHVTAMITFPQAVSTCRVRTVALFGRILSDSDNVEAATHRKVREFSRNYTMAQERAVHESTLSPAAQGPFTTGMSAGPESGRGADSGEATGTGRSAAMSAGDQDLAGNVELF